MLDETQDKLRQTLARARQELADLDERRNEVLHEITRINEALQALTDDGVSAPTMDRRGRRGKYFAFTEYLNRQPREPFSMSFVEIEAIIEQSLAPSARKHLPYWYSSDGSALARSIHAASWKARRVNLANETLELWPHEERTRPW